MGPFLGIVRFKSAHIGRNFSRFASDELLRDLLLQSMKLRVLFAAFLLLAPLNPSIAATPPKAGAICSKAWITKNYKGKKYTCIKSGRKLVWNKGSIIKVAAPLPSPNPSITPGLIPTPTASPTTNPDISASPSAGTSTRILQKKSRVVYSPPTLPSEQIELCKLKQPGTDGVKSGFPAATPLYKGVGNVKWALIPLDFSDLPGEANFMERAQKEMDFASDWADVTSEGRLKVEWKIHDKWIRMPGVSKDYAIPVSDNKGFASPAQQKVWLKAISESDKYFDFTGIQGVQFILPAGQRIIEYGIKGNIGFDVVRNYTTGEGTKIDFFAIPSTFNEELNSGRNFWSWWMYHYLVGLGVAKFGGSQIATELHTYLIQATTEGARDLGGWMRFLIGWMPESRVYCRSSSSLTNLEITLIPLTENNQQGLKLAVFPLSDTRALILESRRETKFSCLTKTERNGVLAYVFDSTLGHMEEYFTAIAPDGRQNENYDCYASPSRDLLLHEGDKVTYQGITIELIGHGDFDQIRLTRTP